MTRDLGTRLRTAGGIALVATFVFYAIAVDGGWYRANGLVRFLAEAGSLMHWRFGAHAFGASNGGMRATSWVFPVFPVLLWGALGTLIAGVIIERRGRRTMSRLEKALSRLGERSPAPVAERERILQRVLWIQVCALVAGVACIVCFSYAPKAKDLYEAQVFAGLKSALLGEIGDGQVLLRTNPLLENDRVMSSGEARLLEADFAREFPREKMRIEREERDRDAQWSRLAWLESLRPKLLTKDQVRVEAHEAYEAWQDPLGSFTGTTLGAAGFGSAFVALLWWAAMLSRRTVAPGFRGYEPEAEDPLFPKYARLGNLSLAGVVLVLVSGWGGIDDAQPAGLAFALLALACAGALGLLAVGLTLRAPLVLARARNPALAAPTAVGLHDQRIAAEAARIAAHATAKRTYAATLHAAGSPPAMIAAAETEAQQLQADATTLQSKLLGGALAGISGRLTAANTQIHALRTQGAPPEAFGAISAATHEATGQLRGLAYAAGWEPWPLQPVETATPVASPVPVPAIVAPVVPPPASAAFSARIMEPPLAPAMPARAAEPQPVPAPAGTVALPAPSAKRPGLGKSIALAAAAVLIGGVVAVVAMTIEDGGRNVVAAEPDPWASPAAPVTVAAAPVPDPKPALAPPIAAPVAADTPEAGCIAALDALKQAMGAASDSAGALADRACVKADGTMLTPADPHPEECEAIWRRHTVNMDHILEVQESTRAACPGMEIGALAPLAAPSMAAPPASPPTSPADAADAGVVPDLSLRDRLGEAPEPAPVSFEVSASSSHKPGGGYTYGGSNIADGDLSTSWQPAKGARGPHWVRIEFARDVTVTEVDIANGFQVADQFGDEFMLNNRVATGRLRFSDGSEQPITFAPEGKGYTRFTVDRVTTNAVTILVDTMHAGTKWHDLAISEVVVQRTAESNGGPRPSGGAPTESGGGRPPVDCGANPSDPRCGL